MTLCHGVFYRNKSIILYRFMYFCNMRIDIITIFPNFFSSFFEHSILKRAQEKKSVNIQIHNLRGYTENKQKTDGIKNGGGCESKSNGLRQRY